MHKQISARVSGEFYERFFKLQEQYDLKTAKEVIEFLLNSFENSDKPAINNNSEALKAENAQLKAQISELENRPTPETPEPQEIIKEIPAQLKENQILVDTNFKEFYALEVTQSAIFEANGAKKTKADILRNLFIQYFSEGVGDWLPISDKHRRNWVNMIKTETEKQPK